MANRIQNVPKLIAASVLTIFAMVLTCRWILDSHPSEAFVISEAKTATACTSGGSESVRTKMPVSHLPSDPILDFTRLEFSEGKEYQGTGRNIFLFPVETHTRQGSPRQDPSPPTAVNRSWDTGFRLTFFGFAIIPREPKKIFCSRDGDLFVGSEGEIIDRHYKIVRISKESVDVEDLLDNTIQTLPLRKG